MPGCLPSARRNFGSIRRSSEVTRRLTSILRKTGLTDDRYDRTPPPTNDAARPRRRLDQPPNVTTMPHNTPPDPATRTNRNSSMNLSKVHEQVRPRGGSSTDESVFEIISVLRRQRWIVALTAALGLAAGILYALKAPEWYQSHAKIMIASKAAGLSGDSNDNEVIQEDVLANHIDLLRSRRIVHEAMEKDGLMDLESIQPHTDPENGFDAADYVIEHLELTRGGGGDAKTARSLRVSLTHTDAADAQKVLDSILVEYQKFIVGQVESVMSSANKLIEQARTDVESGLREAEKEYMAARTEAPVLFDGEGSGNMYQEKYRRLEEELLNLEIEEANLKTRLANVESVLDGMENATPQQKLDQLALIDGESLQRLGLFAGLKGNSTQSQEFQASQPERIAQAQSQYSKLLELMSEKQRLTSIYGDRHPKVEDIKDEITLVQNFLESNQEKLAGSIDLEEMQINPDTLLRTYVGFMRNDLDAIEQRKQELSILSKEAESQARSLINYEIQNQIQLNKIARQEELFNGVVQQLQELDTAKGMTGYNYELLETPRLGKKVWPSIPLSALGGLILGLLGGVGLAAASDVRDARFRSANELEESIGLPILGRVATMPSVRRGVKGLEAAEASHEFEPFRMGRTLLLPDIRSGELKTLGFVSPMQGDGKSMMASNFAVAAAQIGLKTLVIDADLRRPSMHRYFSIEIHDGLSEIIDGTVDPRSAIRETEINGVSVIPAGSAVRKPAEQLQSVKFDELIEELSDDYDFIIVDLPPVLAVSDPLIVAPRLDGCAMVVKVARAKRDEVTNAVRRLKSTGANLVGCLLNGFGNSKNFDDGGGFAGYYESSYTRQGGHRTAGKPARVAQAAEPVSPSEPVGAGASVERNGSH